LPRILVGPLCMLFFRAVVVSQAAVLSPRVQDTAITAGSPWGGRAARALRCGGPRGCRSGELSRFGFVLATFWPGALAAGPARMLASGKL